MNELLWLGFALTDLTLVVVLFRLFGRPALYALIVFNLILCNIQVLKTIELFGLTTTLGNVLYASVFLATDLLGEFHGREAARKGVLLGFATLVMATGYMQLALLFTPAPGDFAQPHLKGIFGFMPRLAAASLAAYLVSQLHDVWAFHFWKRRTDGRMLWLRNNASTLVSQFLDSAIFCLGAFWGLFETPVLVEIFATTYAFKAVVAVLDTPFIYLARHVPPPENHTA
ncbi:queuosine precursor transporter [Desulfocurvus sp. DL9XJH121]